MIIHSPEYWLMTTLKRAKVSEILSERISLFLVFRWYISFIRFCLHQNSFKTIFSWQTNHKFQFLCLVRDISEVKPFSLSLKEAGSLLFIFERFMRNNYRNLKLFYKRRISSILWKDIIDFYVPSCKHPYVCKNSLNKHWKYSYTFKLTKNWINLW
jgi:hypothetical protein